MPRGIPGSGKAAVKGVGPQPTTVEEATANLAQAFDALATAETRTLADADAVLAVKHCIRLGVSTREMSKIIQDRRRPMFGRRKLVTTAGEKVEPVVHKGSGARYIAMARISLGRWLKDETPIPPEGVEVVTGKRYTDPIEALRAQVTHFTGVYTAFIEAVKPRTVDQTKVATSLDQAMHATMLGLKVRVKLGDSTSTLPVLENPEALATLLQEVGQSPVARQLLTAAQRKTVGQIAAALKKAA